MNGVNGEEDIIEIDGNEDDHKDEQSPAKKQGGSSKTSTRGAPNKTHKAVSPQENQNQTEVALSILRTTKFFDNYIHLHRRIVLGLAITLTKEDTFDEFAKALASLLGNAQIVDPKFVINPIEPFSKDKDIITKADISTNMTKLGIHVQISGNGYTFLKKQQIGDKEKQGKKFSKKKIEIRHPTVYFSLIISSSVDPMKIIERCSHKWTRNGGTRMNVKELQDIRTETVVGMFRVSMATLKDAIIGELKMILMRAQDLVNDEDITKFDFSMGPDVPYEEKLPAINPRIQNAKLRGRDVSLFNKLSNRAQYACKSWHVKVASKFAHRMKDLVQYAKDLGLVEKYWGKYAHLTEVTDSLSNLRKTKNQVNLAQSHTDSQMWMMAEDLLRVILLDKTLDIIHPVSNAITSMLSLYDVLLNYLKMSDGHSMIA
jgi:hypothetical protein